jgi:hypothetical protein
MTDYYSDWNLLLLREYFTPAVSGEEIWIQANREELDAFGFHLGGTGGLVDAVRQGPAWIMKQDQSVAQKAKYLVEQRLRMSAGIPASGYQDPGHSIKSYSGLCAPTYLPYVALWVLAASEPEKNGFYATVSNLIGLPFEGQFAREAMEVLWGDLEYWSVQKLSGTLGNFHARRLGGYPFVGLAKAQVLISRKDRGGINQLFKQVGLSPRQKLTGNTFRSLAEIGASSHYLSVGLREALKQLDVYRAVLKEMFQSRLAEWDGRIAGVRKSSGARKGLANNGGDREVEDELALVLRPALDSDWAIGWRTQASAEALSYSLEIDAGIAPGYPDQTNSYITCLDAREESQHVARLILGKSAENDVLASIVYTSDVDENGEARRACCFGSKDLRIMVWDAPSPLHGQDLIESDLPVAGAAYLLVSELANLDYLKNEGVEYEHVDSIEGLPDDWLLAYLPAVERLQPVHKRAIQKLAGGTLDVYAKARIRFVGGCPILRGGAKQYAHYDLPIIELDAPLGAKLSSDGLVFEEILSNDSSEMHVINTRRFSVQRESAEKHQFAITLSIGDEVLTRTKLKVALSTGAASGLDKKFSIGRFGESIKDDTGARGAQIGGDNWQESDLAINGFQISLSWGVALTEKSSVDYFENNIACQFLDMLAQRGSIEFGPARKFIQRLLENTKDLYVNPVYLMLELRSRGHLEIETDQKGHLLRVHKVAPTLYSLPVVDSSSGQWIGVAGSLRLENWRELCSDQNNLGRFDADPFGCIPLVRLSSLDIDATVGFAKAIGFEFATLPAKDLASWAGTLEEARTQLQVSRGYENFRVKNQERLNPQSACFNYSVADFMHVDSQRQCELFRIDDPVIQGAQVYMLGSKINGGLDFNYIQDSRWGVWLAISAFASMMSKLGRSGVSPWPLPYSSIDGSVWLPARMKPPLLVERALCLCAGSSPRQVKADMENEEDQNYIKLVETGNNRHAIGRVSIVYFEMAKGTWLQYQWVPRELAVVLASHLSCELREI